ncbi:hypothetical protein [Rhodococcus wratislaviensis]|uniref:Uncharacterized protein n=1 Tax=Rhodococcus wratislaviensis NBRC 100605 TaxID=1219028 RepID=X0Q7W0_RHOWR|nr:hypothetical protein [Rhodococcus wratislaviensis]GAF46911.1 hypothetical protein RW1_035_00550 [Rhodococcus wratislaviensis NBRC 100605]
MVEYGAQRWRDSAWFDVGVIVSTIVAGTVVAGLLNDPGTSETTPDGAYTYVFEPAPYPAQIPGCDVVEPPSEPERVNFATVGPGEYDNPRYPWFSGAKAAAMTQAAVDALPDSVELVFASPSQSLQFEPITDVDPSAFPEEGDADLFNGSTNARGSLVRDGHFGTLTVDVQAWDRPVLPCMAGALDRRDIRPDGTVLDLLDTWYEINGVRTLERTVVAYLPDGTRIVATASDADNTDPRAGSRHSGGIPLTLDELTAIATTGSLAVTAPIIPAVPLMRSCGAFTDWNGPELTRDKVTRLDRALEARWASMPGNSDLTLDRPIGSLRLTDFGKDNVCEVVTVTSTTGAAGEGRLEIVVVSGQPASSRQDEYLNEIDPNRITTVSADGTTVTRGFYPAHGSAYFSITLPSTQQIIISTTPINGSTVPVTLAQIEYLATAPELDLG